jgi:glycosyltransferase involved in cell wall biosynthesis
VNTLFVSPFSPYPLVFGGAIRLYHLMRMFREFSAVSLIAQASWMDDERDVMEHLGSFCDDLAIVDTATGSTSGLRARSLLGSHSFQHIAYRSARFQRRLDEMLERTSYDCIVVEMTPMAQYDLRGADALRLLDMQNIEHELVRRRASVADGRIRRAALELEWRKVRREELAACRRFDLTFVPSERERDIVQEFVPDRAVVAMPNSIDPDHFGLRSSLPRTNEIAFVGATHVDANRDGLKYFMEAVFPLIEARVPDVHFTIAGGDPPPEIKAYGARPNVDVTGYVPDVRPYLAQAKALVVPLRSGGGTRLKILEGMCVGVPTVSTSIGAEGLELTDGVHLLLADDPHTFADQVVRLLSDERLQRDLGTDGRAVVEERYSWRAVGVMAQREVEAAMVRRRSLAAVPASP